MQKKYTYPNVGFSSISWERKSNCFKMSDKASRWLTPTDFHSYSVIFFPLRTSHSWHTEHFSVPQTHSSFPDLEDLNPGILMKYSAKSAPPSLFTGKLPTFEGQCHLQCHFLSEVVSSHTHMTPLLEQLKICDSYVEVWSSQVALVVKNPPANTGGIGDVRSVPGLGRSPGGGLGNPLQYSCLEKSMGRWAWWATVYEVPKSRVQRKRLSMQACCCCCC